jgi:hypothetical protein
MVVPDDSTGRQPDLRVPSAYRPVDRGKVKEVVQDTNPRVRGIGRLLTRRSGPGVPSGPAKPVQI